MVGLMLSGNAGDRTHLRKSLRHACEDSFNLPDMHEIMTSIQLDHVPEGFLAALGMNTRSLEICSGRSVQEL